MNDPQAPNPGALLFLGLVVGMLTGFLAGMLVGATLAVGPFNA